MKNPDGPLSLSDLDEITGDDGFPAGAALVDEQTAEKFLELELGTLRTRRRFQKSVPRSVEGPRGLRYYQPDDLREFKPKLPSYLWNERHQVG
jgi:hypothetical protein